MRYFENGVATPVWRTKVEAVRDALTVGGRTLVQGALGWLRARSGANIPIPGCRTVEENAGALECGPLSPRELEEVNRLVKRLL